METITLQDTIGQISQAFANLEEAKGEFKDVAESALDAYAEQVPELTQTDRKNIKKIAKALADGRKNEAREEVDSLKELMDQIL